jgi:hypothetical protein
MGLNDYIEGTGLATRILPWWSSIVTVPAASYELLTTNNEIAHGICAALLGMEFILNPAVDLRISAAS